jgi:hypothetical protein
MLRGGVDECDGLAAEGERFELGSGGGSAGLVGDAVDVDHGSDA